MVFRPLPGALPLLFVVVTLTALVGNAQASALVPSENAVSTNNSDSSPQGVLLSLRAEIADLSNRLQAALKALADLVSGNQVSAEDFDAIKAPESTETPSKTPKPTASALVEPLTKSAECPAVPVKPVDVRDHSARRVAKGPLDGDPGLGDLPERMVTDMSKGLPYTFTPQDLHDARLIRMMAREALAGAGVRLSRDRVSVFPPADVKVFVRQEAVRRAFKHAWKGYAHYAWGYDHLQPLSMDGSEGLCRMGLTIVDSLDTLILMDLPEQYFAAREWVRDHLRFDIHKDINVFETTIRIVGGLLGAYELSGDDMFLSKAAELADELLLAFDTPTGIPYGTIDIGAGVAHNPDNPGSSLSEVGSVQLEFHYLTFHTGNPKYAEAVDKAMKAVLATNPVDGLFPMFIDPISGMLLQSPVTLGARGDSLYEYFLKQFLQAGNRRHERMWILDMYNKSVKGILSKLLQYSVPSGYAYIAEQVRAELHTDESSPRLKHKVDHLTCFVPGMLALGAVNAAGVDWKDTAEKFMEMRLNGKLSTMVLAALAEEEKAVAKTTAESSADVSTAGETSESEEVDVPAAAGAVPTFVTPPAAKPNTYTVMKSRDSAFTAGINSVVESMLRPFEVRGILELVKQNVDELLDIAGNLTHTCYKMYTTTTSGLAPEIVTFKRGQDFKPNLDAAHSLLRPETVESIFIMHRLTGDNKYREWGWDIFKAIERNARVSSGGYSGLKDVNSRTPSGDENKDDHMDSFFLAETLKYLYLLYSEPTLLPLEEYVFNTEAHPLRIFNYTGPNDIIV